MDQIHVLPSPPTPSLSSIPFRHILGRVAEEPSKPTPDKDSDNPRKQLHLSIKKKRHHHDDDDDNKRPSHGGDRGELLEAAIGRRADELEDLKRAFEGALEGKKPFDPPTGYGTMVQRAWLHSTDHHDYRDRLESLIDEAEKKLERLEERL